MTGEKQRERLAEFTQRMSDTILKKGDDYAGQEDRLANFKDAGQITGTTAAQQCFNLMGTKMARLKQLLNSKGKPNYESIDDTILDLANYCFLLCCCREDESSYLENFVIPPEQLIVSLGPNNPVWASTPHNPAAK